MKSIRTMGIWNLVCRHGSDRHKAEYRAMRDALASMERDRADILRLLTLKVNEKIAIVRENEELRVDRDIWKHRAKEAKAALKSTGRAT